MPMQNLRVGFLATATSFDVVLIRYTAIFAGVAAEVSVVLRPYDQARAAGYLTSAQAAMTWL